MHVAAFESPSLRHFKSSPPVFEEGLNLSMCPAKVEYQALFLSLKK
jgi:hypothetical protein